MEPSIPWKNIAAAPPPNMERMDNHPSRPAMEADDWRPGVQDRGTRNAKTCDFNCGVCVNTNPLFKCPLTL